MLEVLELIPIFHGAVILVHACIVGVARSFALLSVTAAVLAIAGFRLGATVMVWIC